MPAPTTRISSTKPRQLAHRGLAVLRRIADVAGLWTDHVFEPLLDGFDGGTRVVDAQRGLGDVGHRCIARIVEPLDISLALNEMHLALELAHRALDFGMPGMTDQNHDAALVEIALALMVDLGHQRTDRIEDRQAPRLGIHLDGTRRPRER